MHDRVIEKNLLAVKAHSEETRRLVREVEVKANQIEQLRTELDNLKNQIQALFGRI